ncbi:MAG: putative 3-5 exonuclease [Massilia sp.]|nr:putative 3-5 exonuclease [Massilia sp.]
MSVSVLSHRELDRTDVYVVEHDLPTSVLNQFLTSSVIACDIETTGLDWTTDKIATCQVFSPSAGAYIVRISDEIPRNLASLLDNASVLKVFHHAMFDLRFMHYQWNLEARSVLCTKIAAKILMPGSEDTSLQGVTRDFLGIHLDKTERLSNWLSSSLSPRQLSYAAADVIYLPALISVLQEKLLESGRWDLAISCFEFLPVRVRLDILGAGDVFAYQSSVTKPPQNTVQLPVRDRRRWFGLDRLLSRNPER